MTRRVLVTGAAGFIGSHVAAALLRRGDAVAGLDSFTDFYDPALKRRNVEEVRRLGELPLLEGDVRDPAAVREALRGCDAVVHLAAKAGVRPSLLDPVGYADVNVRGTAVLLEEARAAGVRTFVSASSSSVYGARSAAPFVESDPCDRPVSPYAATKRAMELLCRSFQVHGSMDLTCLRFFTAYGPRQRPEMAIHAFARAIGEGRPVPFYGDGTSRRDYTYIDDIVDGVLRSLDRASGFRIYNLGESATTSLSELVALLEEAVGRRAILDRRPDQPGDVPLTCADLTLARAELGYEPRTPLREGLARFVEWMRTPRG
ncbi:MAG: NAD-dependent epimerase/dehydratase family protein [Planctomycetes bacterium]|nr:NAD-dependent epimerase/dehydratase family protein [Planctomycetota bacterium]